MVNIGAAYYPEHWEEERWREDVYLMEKCGFNTVRMGEFAWSRFETDDNSFDFSWMDRAIQLFMQHGIKVVLCTPTAAPPAWLIEKHPGILPVKKDRQGMKFGERRHYCITSKDYYYYSERIIRKLGEHYSNVKNIIGWQIDNEFGLPRCYCDGCRNEFQKWLKIKYNTLENLNKSWGTVFWSQTYNKWDQIPLPDMERVNPSFFLDYCRFFSDMTLNYSNFQVKILREYFNKGFITHNMRGETKNVNNYDLAREYDFVSWDAYPLHSARHYEIGFYHDEIRRLKEKNFWVMEQQCSYCSGIEVTRTFPPGEMRLWTYHSLSHGADGIIYFNWRACPFGDEQFHSGILQHDGTDNSISFREAARITRELEKIQSLLADSEIHTDIAFLFDFDNIWANESYRQRQLFPYMSVILKYYKAFRDKGLDIDVVHPGNDLSRYRIVLAPLLMTIDASIAENLYNYVENGGVLVSSFRTGIKDKNNNMVQQILPGRLSDLFGISIFCWDTLGSSETMFKYNGRQYKAKTFADLITVDSAKILGSYDSGWYSAYTAISENTYGKGKAIYIATDPENVFFKDFTDHLLEELNYKTRFQLPEDIEVSTRSKNGEKIHFIMNFSGRQQDIGLNSYFKNVLTGEYHNDSISINDSGILILTGCTR